MSISRSTFAFLRTRVALFAEVIFLSTSLSFAVGYLLGQEGNHTPIVIRACSQVASSSLLTPRSL